MVALSNPVLVSTAKLGAAEWPAFLLGRRRKNQCFPEKRRFFLLFERALYAAGCRQGFLLCLLLLKLKEQQHCRFFDCC